MTGAGDLAALVAIRQALHRIPEVSRHEAGTADFIARQLAAQGADRVVTGLGGHGVAAVFDGAAPGPSVMFRAELDGLPITETSDLPYRSTYPGRGHLCGHDGHMCLLLGLGAALARRRPERGRIILMFQPAEEDGSGAASVLADPAFAALRPDLAFAIHNMPGLPLGTAALAEGVVNCASVGLWLRLTGRTAHASLPQTGLSPALALAELIPALGALGQGGALGPGYRLVTVTHARLGEPSFGVAPGEAVIHATLRCMGDEPMQDLRQGALALAGRIAAAHGLGLSHDWQDDFAASVNHPAAVAIAARALASCKIANDPSDLPMRGSEDFGRFGAAPTKAAMIFLGAGDIPALHNPDYDFPDALLPIGLGLLQQIARDILG